jgi:hypothetical protein
MWLKLTDQAAKNVLRVLRLRPIDEPDVVEFCAQIDKELGRCRAVWKRVNVGVLAPPGETPHRAGRCSLPLGHAGDHDVGPTIKR